MPQTNNIRRFSVYVLINSLEPLYNINDVRGNREGRTTINQEKTGKFIAEYRKQKNLTQEQLGEILGISSKSVSRGENGKTLPDYSILESLFNTLEISINDFYYGEKMTVKDFKHLSKQNLRLYFVERYVKKATLR